MITSTELSALQDLLENCPLLYDRSLRGLRNRLRSGSDCIPPAPASVPETTTTVFDGKYLESIFYMKQYVYSYIAAPHPDRTKLLERRLRHTAANARRNADAVAGPAGCSNANREPNPYPNAEAQAKFQLGRCKRSAQKTVVRRWVDRQVANNFSIPREVHNFVVQLASVVSQKHIQMPSIADAVKTCRGFGGFVDDSLPSIVRRCAMLINTDGVTEFLLMVLHLQLALKCSR